MKLGPLLVLVFGCWEVDAMIGGRNATKAEVQQILSLRNIVEDGQLFGSGHYCGAGVINDHLALTAANCLLDVEGDKYMKPGYMRVVGGSVSKDKDELNIFESSIVEIRPHPGFNFRSKKFDVALIKFKKPISIKKRTLKDITLAEKVPPVATNCSVITWGRIAAGPSEEIYGFAQIGMVKLLDMAECEKVHPAIPQNTLCFGSSAVDLCKVGERGSMVFCGEEAVGIVSLDLGCHDSEHINPFIATSIPYFRDWILENGAGNIRLEGGVILLIVCCVLNAIN